MISTHLSRDWIDRLSPVQISNRGKGVLYLSVENARALCAQLVTLGFGPDSPVRCVLCDDMGCEVCINICWEGTIDRYVGTHVLLPGVRVVGSDLSWTPIETTIKALLLERAAQKDDGK